MIYTKYKYLYKIYCFFLHILPALLIDTYFRLTGQEPKMKVTYDKIHKFSEVIAYFSTKQWKFIDNNVQNLWIRLSDQDKELFHFSLKDLDWREYFRLHVLGIRQYLMKESLDTLPQAWSRFYIFQILHYTVIAAICSMLVWTSVFVAKLVM